MELFGDITDEVDDGLEDWMRHRDSVRSRDTYDRLRDDGEFHASAGCLGECSPHGEVAEGQIAPQRHTLSCHLLRASGP